MLLKTWGSKPSRMRALLPLLVLLSCAAPACGDPNDPPGASGSSGSSTCEFPCPFEALQVGYKGPERLDLLLSIDNSRSMADKQAILAEAVPDLVRAFVNPRCVDEAGVPATNQPASPFDACPAGTLREFAPMFDVHIGLVTSSIGGHGSDSCPDVVTNSLECAGKENTTNNDHGRLVARVEACGAAAVPTYQEKGFLAWDPAKKLTPPGEGDIDLLLPSLRDMVKGAGEIGCGYESQLESIYRFLADPYPYASISLVNDKATPEGTDTLLLEQRKSFLRPNSVLAIVMLSDEDDCSLKEYGQFYYVAQQQLNGNAVRMPRAREICQTDPTNECCKSCGQGAGSCPVDPTCEDPSGNVALLSAEEDNPNLRCYNQKQRFGIDFLYPTDRYIQAFSSNTIPDRAGNLVDNPIFSDLDPSDDQSLIRKPSLVFFAGIVGVPWQDIARDKTDLKKGFKDAGELAADLGNGATTWDIILGDPPAKQPLDPLMVASVAPRSGTNPITGDPLVDPSAPLANPINGNERTIAGDDLQYACIFPLPPGSERSCADPGQTSCDCVDPTNDSPLCAPDPQNGGARTLQVRTKAYPAIRALDVLKGMRNQGITASVCPAELDQGKDAADYGYRPAMTSIIERLKGSLRSECLPRTLKAKADGQVACAVVEGQFTNEPCSCSESEGRRGIPHSLPDDATDPALLAYQITQMAWDELFGYKPDGYNLCFCEIKQLEGAALQACLTDIADPTIVAGAPIAGFCYVDPASNPAGNAELLVSCPDDAKRDLRFVGEAKPRANAKLFAGCRP